MICGTSPTHVFPIPFDTILVKEVLVTYLQGDTEVLRKETADCTMDGRYIGVLLTQEETLSFDHKKHVKIQLRVLTTEGVPFVSPVYVVDVKQCLSSEVLK